MPSTTTRTIRQRAVSRIERELYGGRRIVDPNIDIGDPGLCSPDSVSWKVFSDPSAGVSLIRAFQVQAAHPALTQCLYDHGSWRESPRRRFRSNLGFQLLVTFGSRTHVERVASLVNRAHASMSGTLPDGSTYSANDRELLWWAQASIVDSAVVCWDTFGPGPALTAQERDELVSEQAPAAALLGLESPPMTWADVQVGMLQRKEMLAPSQAAVELKSFIRDVDWAPPGPRVHRLFCDAASTTLPDWIASPAGFVADSNDTRAAQALVRSARVLLQGISIAPERDARTRIGLSA